MRQFSKEHREKLSKAHKGKNPWNKGIFGLIKQSKETREKRSIALMGHSVSDETKRKISEAQKGDKAHSWKDGRSLIMKIKDKFGMSGRHQFRYNGMAGKAMEIDKVCTHCSSGNDLLIHHFNKNKEDNRIENLIVLCRQCHSKFHKTHLDSGKKPFDGAMTMAGAYLFTLRNAFTNEIEKRHFAFNVICKTGRTLIANNLTDPTPDNDMLANYAALGSNAAVVSENDTILGTETYRNAVASRTNADNIAYITAFFNQTEVTGTFKEAGIFCDATGVADSGILLSHVNIDITKSNTQKLTIDWTLTLLTA